MAVEVEIKGLDGVVRTLNQLPAEVVSKNGGPVRSALRKASLLFKNEMQANIQKILDEPNKSGGDVHTLRLLRNIVTIRQKMPTGVRGERYKIGPRLRRMYPKASPNAKEVSVVQVGRLLETGTERRIAMPWSRPAYEAKKGQVIPLFVSDLDKKLKVIVKKLAAKNGVA